MLRSLWRWVWRWVVAEGDTIVVRDGHQVLGPATLLTGGETEQGNFFRGPDDPMDTPAYAAIIEAGDLWIIPTETEPPFERKVRNAANDGWIADRLVSTDGAGAVVSSVLAEADGTASVNAINAVGGATSASVAASASEAYSNITATAVGGGVSVGFHAEIEESTGQFVLWDGTGSAGTAGSGVALISDGVGGTIWGLVPYTPTGGLSATYLAGAVDELEAAKLSATQAAAVADVVGSDPADIATTLNALLASMRASGELAP